MAQMRAKAYASGIGHYDVIDDDCRQHFTPSGVKLLDALPATCLRSPDADDAPRPEAGGAHGTMPSLPLRYFMLPFRARVAGAPEAAPAGRLPSSRHHRAAGRLRFASQSPKLIERPLTGRCFDIVR